MTTVSPHINGAIRLALAAGYSIKETSDAWSAIKLVVYMNAELTSTLRGDIQSTLPSLRYWITDRTAHYAAEEGFVCDEYQVGLTFLRLSLQ